MAVFKSYFHMQKNVSLYRVYLPTGKFQVYSNYTTLKMCLMFFQKKAQATSPFNSSQLVVSGFNV